MTNADGQEAIKTMNMRAMTTALALTLGLASCTKETPATGNDANSTPPSSGPKAASASFSVRGMT